MDGGRKAGAKGDGQAAASPMMAQYLALKRENPDTLLFYRMGDFYELFFEDAIAASAALDITLTRRGKHEGADIPMCGVPVHAADSYLARLVRKGFKVAIGEQVEDAALAKKRGNKALVRRAVTRIVTPGTITEESLLDARAHNYLAALGRAGGELALAWLDISTGDLSATPTEPGALDAELARLEPGEILVSEAVLAEPALYEVLGARKAALSPLPPLRFDSAAAEKRLTALYRVASLEGFGAFGRAELAVLGAIVDYVELTQKGRLPSLRPPRRLEGAETMAIDAATRRNLELTQSRHDGAVVIDILVGVGPSHHGPSVLRAPPLWAECIEGPAQLSLANLPASARVTNWSGRRDPDRGRRSPWRSSAPSGT